MPISIPAPTLFVLIGAVIVFIGFFWGGLFLLRWWLRSNQKSTLEALLQLQTTTQERLQHLEIAQASTQTMVTTTQQETQRFVQNLETLQHASQALMLEIKTLHTASQTLMIDWQKETAQLSRALRTTYQQGMWGELALRRILDITGMTQHCDFDVKPRFPNGQVPDYLIHFPNGRTIAIDSKAPSQVYLEAMKNEDEETRTKKLEAYAKRVREIMNELAKKEYWKELQPTLALVILFLPNEAMFRAALEYGPGLMEAASEKNVMLASPVTLIALLKAIEYGWDQEQRAQNVQQIVDQSKDLQKELEVWFRQWQALRKAVQNTSTEFNRVTMHYGTHILPVIKALNILDTTKEKTFELKPLEDPLVDLENEDKDDRSATTKEEQRESFWPDTFTQSLKRMQKLFPLDFLLQEKEGNSSSPGKDHE